MNYWKKGKVVSLAEKPSELKQSQSKVYYPSISVREKLSLDGDDVGKTFNVRVKMKLSNYGENTQKGETKYNYQFDCIEMELL